jgi:type II secretion system protein G
MKKHLQAGFTSTELVVVLLVLAILAGALVPRVTSRLSQSRDARRVADIKTVQDAIEQYLADKHAFPKPRANQAAGDWDISNDGDFIPELVQAGYLREAPTDPINDDTYHYRYFVYPQGTAGCDGAGEFYVLGIKTFENADFAGKNPGYFKCSGRDWTTEFAYVTGGNAAFHKPADAASTKK